MFINMLDFRGERRNVTTCRHMLRSGGSDLFTATSEGVFHVQPPDSKGTAAFRALNSFAVDVLMVLSHFQVLL